MVDYQIQGNTRRCAVTGRELRPGEKVYTVLLDRAGKFVRQDYGGEVWQGPPADAYGFWVGKVHSPEGPRRPPIDDELLLDCFRRLEGQRDPKRVQFRYIVGLLLLRRKRLKFEEARTEAGQEVMKVRCTKSREVFEVVNPGLGETEMETVQEKVFQVLGWE
jgi:hypothetical protein